MKLQKRMVIGGSALALAGVMLSTSTSRVYAAPTTSTATPNALAVTGPQKGQATTDVVQWWGQAAGWAVGGAVAGAAGWPAGVALGAAGGFVGYAVCSYAAAHGGIVTPPAIATRALD